jgi:hypothetical protein
MALAVAKSQRVHAESFALRDGEHGGGVEAAAQENDGWWGRGVRIQRSDLGVEI